MSQIPDGMISASTIQAKVGDLAALYALYKGINPDAVPHAADQMLSPNELQMLQYVDAHPEVQQLLQLGTPLPFGLLVFHVLASLLVVFHVFYHLPPFCKKVKRTLLQWVWRPHPCNLSLVGFSSSCLLSRMSRDLGVLLWVLKKSRSLRKEAVSVKNPSGKKTVSIVYPIEEDECVVYFLARWFFQASEDDREHYALQKEECSNRTTL